MFTSMQGRMCARIVPLLRAVVATFSNDDLATAQLSNESIEDQSGASIHSEEHVDMGCVIFTDRVFRILLARLSRFVRTRATLMHSTQYSRLLQHVCKFRGVKPSSAMKVNAWICTHATDSDLESGMSVQPTVILRVV